MWDEGAAFCPANPGPSKIRVSENDGRNLIFINRFKSIK
jgi:hypothetical protein